MKRLLLLFTGLLILAGAFLLALALAPAQVEQTWRSVGLPADGLQLLSARLPGHRATSPAQPSALIVSGTLQAEETHIAAEITGQIDEVLVEKGQVVQRGQTLLRLNDPALRAQLAEAGQGVQTARANLALAQARPRPSQIAAAAAAVRQAQVELDGAKQELADSQRALADLQDLTAQIHSAQGRLALARRRIEQARARQAAVEARRASVAGDGSDQGKTQQAIYDRQIAAATEAVAAAEAEANGAQRVVAFLQEVKASPVSLDAQVHSAQSQVKQAEASLHVAEAALALASAKPRSQAVALAEAQLAQAEAAEQTLRVQVAKLELTSPLSGTITSRVADPGEMALAGAPLLVVSDLGRITLVVYVPEPRLGEVNVGQKALIGVDAYPGRVFPGIVSSISSRAEFTPQSIQTEEGRDETVFAVEITLDNAGDLLRPGMPADAEFVPR